ncbi:MAG: SRPBCC domain-containing protein [Gemmatimonadota bacterium]|nr:SRPBCC domain-containing protein [Gemmatimonadota bacterium]
MDTGTQTSLSITKVIPAGRDAVFRAWTDPEEMRKWSCPEGAEVAGLTVDLRVGGAFRIEMKGEDGSEYTAFGTYREIDAPNRLVYTWDWEQPDHAVGETVVTVTFNDLGESTEIVLEHDLFPAVEAVEGHRQGWTSALAQFEALFVTD